MTQDDAVGERAREHKQVVLPWESRSRLLAASRHCVLAFFPRFNVLFIAIGSLRCLKAYNEKNRLGGRTLNPKELYSDMFLPTRT